MSPTPRVWLVTAYPLWSRDGYARNVEGLLDALGDTRLSGVVSVVPLSQRLAPELRAWQADFRRRRKCELVLVFNLPDGGLSGLRALADMAARLAVSRVLSRAEAAVVHARGIRAGFLCSTVTPATVLLDIRGDAVAEAELCAIESGRADDRRRVRWAARETETAIRRADGFLVVSRGMAEWLASHRVGTRPVWSVPCPVDVDSFAKCPHRVSNEVVVGYLGGLQVYQSADLVGSELASLVGELGGRARTWVVTGSDSEGLKRRLDASGVHATIESLPHAEVRRRLCEMDVGIVPRAADQVSAVSCPTKIGEYLAAGVPVLVGEGLSAWAELLAESGAGGMLGAGAARMIEEWMVDREETARACRALAERLWSWTIAKQTILEAYEHMAGSGGQRA